MDDPPHPTDQEPDAHKASARRDATIGWAILGVLLAVALITLTTTGFGPYEATAEAARPPTLWDWLGLLIVPLAVAAGAAYISYVQKRTELDIAQKARQEDREIARQARESEQQIASDRLQQASLEGYYDRMTDLLLNHHLMKAVDEAEERSIARARTVAVVRGLDGERKAQLLAFLKTSGLIDKDRPVIDLQGVDFSGAILGNANLYEANLSGANLSEANLGKANLLLADLRKANLGGANLSGANLLLADLRKANLSGANLSEATLGETNLSEADLIRAKLCEAMLNGADLNKAKLSEADLSGAILNGANLNQADLDETNLSEAHLVEADLSEANLSRANLSGANLMRANLIGATGWTMAQLEQAGLIVENTMPDGTRLARLEPPDSEAVEAPTFEEWRAQYLAAHEID